MSDHIFDWDSQPSDKIAAMVAHAAAFPDPDVDTVDPREQEATAAALGRQQTRNRSKTGLLSPFSREEKPKRLTAWADPEEGIVSQQDIRAACEAGYRGDKLPDYDFILPGGVAGDVGVIAGGGNLGKSWMAIQMSISLACGIDIFGLFSGVPTDAGWTLKRRKVAYISLEDNADTATRRLHSIFAFLLKSKDKPQFSNIDIKKTITLIEENFHIVDMSGKGEKAYVSADGMTPEDRDEIVNLISDRFVGFDLIIFDTLRRSNSHDENDNVGANRTLSQFDQIAANLKCMILVLTHVTKEASFNGDTQIEVVRGSGVWSCNTRYGCVMAPVGQQKDKGGKRVRVDEYLRRHFVRLAIPKANKIAPINEIWLHRSSSGVLYRTDIDVDAAILMSMSNPDLTFLNEDSIRTALEIAGKGKGRPQASASSEKPFDMTPGRPRSKKPAAASSRRA